MANSVAYHNNIEFVARAQSVFQEEKLKQVPYSFSLDGKFYAIFKGQIIAIRNNNLSFYTDSHRDYNSDKLNERIEELEKLFDIEWQKNKNYIKIDSREALNKSIKTIKRIAKINYEKILVELSPTNAIIFKILLKKENNLLLLLTFPFSKIQNLEKDEVIYSLFENRELIVSNAKPINEVVEGINEYTKQ